MWPSRSPPRAHWRTIRSHTDIWDPDHPVQTIRDAITWASGLSEVDAERIGIWGSSYSGAHVLVVGAIDRRVKCIVAQVPLISGHANARRLIRADFIGQVQAACLEDRRARYQRKPPGMIPVVSEDPIGPAVLPTADSWQWFIETARTRAPAWRNEVTLRSVEMVPGIRTGRAHHPY
jgi:dienelactone hydrolase